jgi:hypothetical protein
MRSLAKEMSSFFPVSIIDDSGTGEKGLSEKIRRKKHKKELAFSSEP